MTPRLQERANAQGVPLEVVGMRPDGSLLGDADGAQLLVAAGIPTDLGAEFLRGHPSVRWLAVLSAGVDSWMLPEVVDGRLIVTRTRHRHDVPVAEFAMATMLAAAKHLPRLILSQQRQQWLDLEPPLLQGKTLTIVGYGEIGRALARRAKAFEMHVVGVRTEAQTDEVADRVFGAGQLREALALGDYVVTIVPGGAQRRHIIGEAELRALRPDATFVNVGRGEVVDEEALDRVLREGAFAEAFIDTFETEPLPLESPLWTNPRVVVTCHNAGLRGGRLTEVSLDQVVENVRRFTAGEPLLNTVDVTKGY